MLQTASNTNLLNSRRVITRVILLRIRKPNHLRCVKPEATAKRELENPIYRKRGTKLRERRVRNVTVREKSGKLAKRRMGELEGREEGITQLHVGLMRGRACSRRHDLPAKGRERRKEPNGGWQDWIWKFNASNISAAAPALGYSFYQTSRLSGLPILPVSLFISRPRCLLHRISIFDVARIGLVVVIKKW